MMKILSLNLFLLVLIFISCNKEESKVESPIPPITIQDTNAYLKFNITTNFAGSRFVCNQRYNNVSNYTVSIDNLKFYLSNIYAIKVNGDSVLLSQIELFDYLENDTSFTVKISKADYQGITFGIGVPTNLNSPANPDFLISVFDHNSPLSGLNGTFWGWQSGYRFFIFDGRFDLLPNSLEPNLTGFSIHTGNDEVFKTIEFAAIPFDISESGTKNLTLNFDVSKFFYSDSNTIDLQTENDYHGDLSTVSLAIDLTNNIANSIQYQAE